MPYICAKFREIISKGIKVIEWAQFLYGKIQRGLILPKMQVEQPLLISACCLVMLYISTNFVKSQSYRVDTISILKITKGNNSQKNVGRVTVVISARRLVMLYISTKFLEIISSGIKVIERTRFPC